LSARNVRVASSSSTTRIVEASSAVMPLLGPAPADLAPAGVFVPALGTVARAHARRHDQGREPHCTGRR
jgi:hypothetical protein